MQDKQLIRLTGLWKSQAKSGSNYLTGSISASSKLIILPNTQKQKDSDPDFIAYLAPAEKKEPTKQKSRSEAKEFLL